MTIELNGADGSVLFDLEEPEYLQYFEYKQQQSGRIHQQPQDALPSWQAPTPRPFDSHRRGAAFGLPTRPRASPAG